LGIHHLALLPQILVLKTEEMGCDMELSSVTTEMHPVEMGAVVIAEQ
jgi:hypothetical protein